MRKIRFDMWDVLIENLRYAFRSIFMMKVKKSIIVKFEPIKTTLDYNSSRAAEQILINKYGMKKMVET